MRPLLCLIVLFTLCLIPSPAQEDEIHEDAVIEVQVVHGLMQSYVDDLYDKRVEECLIDRVLKDLDDIEAAEGEAQFIADVRKMEFDFKHLQQIDKLSKEVYLL